MSAFAIFAAMVHMLTTKFYREDASMLSLGTAAARLFVWEKDEWRQFGVKADWKHHEIDKHQTQSLVDNHLRQNHPDLSTSTNWIHSR